MPITEKILFMLLLGVILLTLDNQERRIQALDKRVTHLEEIMSKNKTT